MTQPGLARSTAAVGGGQEDVRLGLRVNLAQFVLLAVVNFFVGGMVGLERTVTPLVGSEQFHLGEITIAAFVVVFGFTKAIILLEEGCEEFTNVQGLGQIRFPRGNIRAVFEEVRQVLEREGLLETPRRIADMYEEIFAGLEIDPGSYLSVGFEADPAINTLDMDVQIWVSIQSRSRNRLGTHDGIAGM